MASLSAAERPLTEHEIAVIAAARAKANDLYAGVKVAHRSCGIALAETFDLATRPYQALRKGGITGAGFCGSIKAGELILGELLGDPSPTGSVTDALRSAMEWFQAEVARRIPPSPNNDYVCNHLVALQGDFLGPQRKSFCTKLAAEVAAIAAEALLRFGLPIRITPIAIPQEGSP